MLGKESSMSRLFERAVCFFRSEEGPTATEYAVMLALIIVVALAAITALGEKVTAIFNGITGALAATGY